MARASGTPSKVQTFAREPEPFDDATKRVGPATNSTAGLSSPVSNGSRDAIRPDSSDQTSMQPVSPIPATYLPSELMVIGALKAIWPVIFPMLLAVDRFQICTDDSEESLEPTAAKGLTPLAKTTSERFAKRIAGWLAPPGGSGSAGGSACAVHLMTAATGSRL